MKELFFKHGFNDFKWINPKEQIVVSHWVRMKCVFGCPGYGQNASCPPNTLAVTDCEKFFQEYTKGVIFHFEKKLENPEDRHEWSRELNLKLIELEKEVFLSGHVKAFLLFMDSCEICKNETCTKIREECIHPKLSRPTPEGMAIDVFTTVRKVGYPIEVLKDYTEIMNRYAFLLVE
jgi:predicted metal-binding protein